MTAPTRKNAMNKISTALIASALSLAMAPAFAQEDAPILSVDGDVMVSQDGEFVTATNGQTVTPGQSLMVQEDSAARVTYSEDCYMDYTVPATYTVESDCDRPVAAIASGNAVGTGASAGMTVGIVAGVVALSAAAIHSNLDGDPVPPISP